MALTNVESIESAIHLIDRKKDNLKKAFEELQCRSALLSSFAVSWKDLDSYFTSLKSDVVQNFSTLQKTFESSPLAAEPTYPITAKLVPARRELKYLCEKMDGLGLRKYLIGRQKELEKIQVELVDAFKHSPDPGAMVLDAMEGFSNQKRYQTERWLRRVCLVLLEEFMRSGLEFGEDVQKRASAMVKEWDLEISSWKQVVGRQIREGHPRLGYLLLLASFKLFNDSAFNENELIDYVASIAKYKQAVSLCRSLCLESRIPDVIQRIMMKDKALVTLKFIFEFELTDKFPPVPLLKSFVMDVTNDARNIRKVGNNSLQALNEAGEKEISAMKSVIKCVKDHNLESQYPMDDLEARLESLEKEHASRKKNKAVFVPSPKFQTHKSTQNGKKRAKTASEPSSSVSKRKIPANNYVNTQPSNRAVQITGHATRYLDQPAGPYGMVKPAYAGPSANMYGLSAAPPGLSNLYPSGTHAHHDHYAGAVGYDGYDVPAQYHQQLYYPH